MTLMVTRNFGPLGMSLNDANVVTQIRPGSAAEGVLEVGDKILGIDGQSLKGRKLMQVIKPQPSHAFNILREERGAGHGGSGRVQPPPPPHPPPGGGSHRRGSPAGLAGGEAGSDRHTDMAESSSAHGGKRGWFGGRKKEEKPKKDSIIASDAQLSGWGF